MDEKLIFEGNVSLEDLLIMHGMGYEFVIDNGKVTCYGREAVK